MKKRFYETKAFRWILAGMLAFVLVSSNVVDKMVRIYANEEGQVDQVDNSAAEEAARQAEEAARREAEAAARRAEEEAARKAEEEAARKAAEEEAARKAQEEAARKAAEEEAARKAAEEEAARKAAEAQKAAEEEAARKAAEEAAAAEAAQKAAEEEAARKAAEEAAAAEAAQKAAEEEAARKAQEEAARKAQEEAERKAAEEAAKPTEVPVTAAPTEIPTAAPTEAPTLAPTEAQTAEPTEAPTAAPTEEPTAEPEVTIEPTLEPTVTPEPTLEPTPEPVAPGTATFYIWVDGAYEDAGSAQITREGNACYVSKDDVRGMCADLGLKESELRGAWTWGIGGEPNPGNANSRLSWNNGRYEFPGYDEKAAGADVFVLADKSFNVSTEQEEKPVQTAVPTLPPNAEPEATAEPTTEPEQTPEPEATVEPTFEPEATIVPEATIEPTMKPEATEQPVTEPGIALYTATISVNGKSVNVREAANADSALVGRIFDGATVEVFAEVDGWCLVQGESVDRAQIKGYVSAKFVKQGAEPVATPETTAEPTVEPEATIEPTALPEPTPEPTVAPETETTLPPYEYQRNEDGALVLDESGNPIAIVPEGAEIPVSFKRDETGALVLDENGNPIPLSTVPADADKISSILDELNPERYIDIYAVWDNDVLQFGDKATLIAVLHGYENTVYTIQWQNSGDAENWTDVEGAVGERYTLEVTEDNHTDYWRVQVLISDVL